MKPLTVVALLLLSRLAISAAHAETLQVPEGGRFIPLGNDRILCGEPPEGWKLSADRRTVRPPASANAANRTFQATVGADASECGKSKTQVTLLATGPWPDIDPSGISFYPDEGRIEIRGTRLAGTQVAWSAANEEGSETCLAPTKVGKFQQCSLPLQRDLPTSTVLRRLPAFAKSGQDVVTFNALGKVVDPATTVLRPARTIITQVFAAAEAIDISQGVGNVPVAHPEAISNADCGLARCEFADGNLTVRYVPSPLEKVYVSVRLAPRFFLSHGDKLENSASASFTVLRCPLTVASGPPMRDADDPHILIHMADRCRSNARLRWTVGSEPAEIEREVRSADGTFVLLRSSQIAGGSVTISAMRADTLASVVGSVTTPTMPPPRLQSEIELPKYGPISFIPTNREAQWSVAAVAHARLVPLDLPGAYAIRRDKDRTFVRGTRNGGGFVSLRYGYQRDDLPEGFENVNLAILTETITRPLREASVPVAFSDPTGKHPPLAQFLCADEQGDTVPLDPGKPGRIALSSRDTCRVVIYQDRLSPEDGQQEVVLEIEVTKASGGKRSEGTVNEHMVLRPGGDPRVFFLKGIVEQFDQITVRLSHVVDENRYVLAPTGKQSPPSIQWSATVEGGRVRLYVSLSIPAGLYRMNEPAASLSLNFGVLGRITWLTEEGKEGLLGLETGVLGASLIPQQSDSNPPFPPTLLTLLGIGLRVKVGEGAAIGVHLWGAYEFRSEYHYTPSGETAERTASHWSILFGPSISIGNVGTNL